MMRLGLGILVSLLAVPALSAVHPIIEDFTTCSGLTRNFYPADTTTWFDASRDRQIVLFAQMMFPFKPGQDDLGPLPSDEQPWHPPEVVGPVPQTLSVAVNDNHYVQAQCLDPDGQEVAAYGLTMPARVSSDYLRLGSREYIPHTFAMSLGTKNLNVSAGQKTLPSKAGEYSIRLYVDRELEGIAFFRMMTSATVTQSPVSATPQALTESAEEERLNSLGEVLQTLTGTAQ